MRRGIFVIKNMKCILWVIAMSVISVFGNAQQIPKTVVAEHFTNTYCSICAARNPGLFSNLHDFPQVIHIAYYPSAPYAACPLSMHNPIEADARTNYYGIYGGTPQLVVGGSVVSGAFTDPTIFSSQLSATTSFALGTAISKVGIDSIAVTVVVKKVDTSSLTSLQLSASIVEDTLSFIAHNGETANYDVFRKALWGTSSLSITAPVSVGDSSVYTKTVAINSVWNLSRLYSVSILQRGDKEVVQASKSAHLELPASVGKVFKRATIAVYPNPATDKLFIDKQSVSASVHIIDNKGREVKYVSELADEFIDLSSLQAGAYFLIVDDHGLKRSAMFIKQ
jgi:hypothetical protein